jgi:3-hydroxyisobutyryl-CoA hydrolase
MVLDITSQIDYLSTHKAIWMEGAGGKAFCAGGDVKALFVGQANKADRVHFFRKEFSMDYRLTQLKAMQIANWDGIVMGGGVGISAFSPFIIAT